VSGPASFGRWPSPLSPSDVAAQRRSRSALASDGSDLWWLEGRPQEQGRVVLVRLGDGEEPVVVSPPGTSIRSRVHEYGGGAWCLLGHDRPGAYAFVEERSQRVFLGAEGAPPVPLTDEPTAGERWHHGNLVAGPDATVLGIRERHHDGGVERDVIALGPGRQAVSLCSGRTFFGSLALSSDRTRLAWIAWDHPNMPWDETELWVATFDVEGPALVSAQRVGAPVLAGCSVDQPVWLDDGGLAFVADARGWWQPWRWRGNGDETVEPITALEAEFQGPAWALGQHTLVALGTTRLGSVWRRDGTDRLGVLETDGTLARVDQPCVSVSSLCAHRGGLAWLGQTPSAPGAVWWADPDGQGPARPLTTTTALLAAEDVSVAEPVSVPGRDGRVVHANFYAPRLRGSHGGPGQRPPLVVHCHGGPTGSAESGFDPFIQMLTTRGFAVAAVDYAGSTGYGRAYRHALDGRWGEADIDDCVDAARWLAEAGRVDPTRMAIRGASAGGLTALGALVRSRVFAAAVSWYGVSDLMGLVATTHDFEARYTDRLVGPLPEAAALYRDRSPLYRVDDLEGAVLLLQGEDDPVVPPEQTRSMAAALAARGLRCEVRTFAGESHGFRRADTLVAAYEAELAFYDEVLLGPDTRI
jgi:dipeptidyl aminopeptidase/acylaminoacyl peptidase